MQVLGLDIRTDLYYEIRDYLPVLKMPIWNVLLMRKSTVEFLLRLKYLLDESSWEQYDYKHICFYFQSLSSISINVWKVE